MERSNARYDGFRDGEEKEMMIVLII